MQTMTTIHLFVFTIFVLVTSRLHGFPIAKDSPPPTPVNSGEFGEHFEGDIKFPPGGARSLASGYDNVLWPNNTVPYEISPLYTSDQVAALIFGMRLLENLTAIEGVPCVTFRPKVPEDGNYSIYIYNGPGCSSYVGRNTGYNFNRTTSLNYPFCFTNGTIMHEYLHTLGIFHEQSRPDRDSYVIINFDTIATNATVNFQEYTTGVLTLNTPYDYGSVMHYPRNAFSINGSDTIVPLDPNAQIGQRITLSPYDIQGVRTLYSCTGPGGSATTTTSATTSTTSTTTKPATMSTTTKTTTTSTTTKTTTTSTTTKTTTTSTTTSTTSTTTKTTTTSTTTSTTTKPTTTSTTTKTTTTSTTTKTTTTSTTTSTTTKPTTTSTTAKTTTTSGILTSAIIANNTIPQSTQKATRTTPSTQLSTTAKPTTTSTTIKPTTTSTTTKPTTTSTTTKPTTTSTTIKTTTTSTTTKTTTTKPTTTSTTAKTTTTSGILTSAIIANNTIPQSTKKAARTTPSTQLSTTP